MKIRFMFRYLRSYFKLTLAYVLKIMCFVNLPRFTTHFLLNNESFPMQPQFKWHIRALKQTLQAPVWPCLPPGSHPEASWLQQWQQRQLVGGDDVDDSGRRRRQLPDPKRAPPPHSGGPSKSLGELLFQLSLPLSTAFILLSSIEAKKLNGKGGSCRIQLLLLSDL